MTTTRINHTGHAHASTTAARTACRKAMKVTTVELPGVPVCVVGNGRVVHLAVIADNGGLMGARCGAGLTRNGSDSNVTRIADLPAGTAASCHRCN